ncbi:MAG: cell division protein ZapA [Magnetococcales bacterium]|nr:cell division protein ZapA [Magnetococcales bacterium]
MADSIDVTIHGQLFRLRLEANSAYVRELAGYVDSVMDKMARQSRSPSSDRLAIMAALRIADSLFQAKEQMQQMQQVQPSDRADDGASQELHQINQRIGRMVAAGQAVLQELKQDI